MFLVTNRLGGYTPAVAVTATMIVFGIIAAGLVPYLIEFWIGRKWLFFLSTLSICTLAAAIFYTAAIMLGRRSETFEPWMTAVVLFSVAAFGFLAFGMLLACVGQIAAAALGREWDLGVAIASSLCALLAFVTGLALYTQIPKIVTPA